MKKQLIKRIFPPLLLIIAIFIGITSNDELYRLSEQSEAFKVVRVVDGDTVIVDMNGKNQRVRLIGVDAPESTHPDEERNEEYGEVAAAFTAEKLEGKSVTLEYDVEKWDQYDRLLAYVYIDEKMFNETLIEEGYARAVTYPPNVRYTDRFEALQKQAQKDGKGIWAE